MNIYISAPITGRTVDDITLVFSYAKTQLEYYGHRVIDPWAIGQTLPELKHEDYLAIDKEIIARAADAVYFCAGWQSSKGCQSELALCEALGIKTYFDISEVAKEAQGGN